MLILDDATASVDPETEEMIRRGMRFVMQGRTTFVIAHRVSTVKAADLVVVLENGAVTQTGTHEQLMREDGHYRDIASAQLFGDENVHRLRLIRHRIWIAWRGRWESMPPQARDSSRAKEGKDEMTKWE